MTVDTTDMNHFLFNRYILNVKSGCEKKKLEKKWKSIFLRKSIKFIPTYIKDSIFYKYRYKSYWRTFHVHKDIKYSLNSKSMMMDIYEPEKKNNKPNPTIVFIKGGYYLSGDKKDYSRLGKVFSKLGYLTIIPNYSLYPKANFSGILEEVDTLLQYVYETVEIFGGSKDNINLIGHSVGATLLSSYLARNISNPIKINWIKSMFLISGAYDLEDLFIYETQNGTEEILPTHKVYGGFAQMNGYSPNNILQQYKDNTITLQPNVIMIHSEPDRIFPSSQSLKFFETLKRKSTNLSNIRYFKFENYQHIEFIIT
ncbi:hypothetical protein PPL_04237 [Heterostelium album PN500]|uniref:BD-FAE-like domain-containing protein n=1 Tax=Heterostelium pallidum (strain ATCC 26659 / Pp 5 / PN500) TaxID=670386 RepID=D3B706_HETP5|nr:hypothetical protein PPL_04237 [Heterostelium album PN500]EFA82549.1 hypothetical protein PPL_04237 [Heterostelium album PN500]|eukprot:XP_020434666.1 hypothetical protein PPL_04237 [Heterostelium album PN500]